MNKDRVIHIMRFALAAAAREDDYKDRELGPIHLIKLVYLADLAHAAETGETYTGAPWVFWNFGPWSQDVNEQIEPAVHHFPVDRRTFQHKDGDGTRWRLKSGEGDRHYDQLERGLPLSVVGQVKRTIHQYGHNTYSLLDHVYRTPPMIHAKPKDRLDFSYAIRPKNLPQTPSEPPQTLSKTAQKKRKARMEELRARLKKQVQEKKALRAARPTPRYDDIYFEGMKALDELAGPPPNPTEAVLIFDDEIWTSDIRSMDAID